MTANIIVMVTVTYIVGQAQVDLVDWAELTMAVVPPLLQWVGVDEEGKDDVI